MSKRDATKQARGFSYQRQYCIYLFFNRDVNEIIEEGIMDNLHLEDITLRMNNNLINTYQIKYHSNKMGFNPSNSDLFKTLGNIDNMNVNQIHFIVSKLETTFDSFLTNWKDKDVDDIYKKIMSLKPENKKSCSDCKNCQEMFRKLPQERVFEYLYNFSIEEGYTYKELIENINNKIKDTFKVHDDILVFFIRFSIFELFDNNWFSENKPIIVRDTIETLKDRLKLQQIENTYDTIIDNFVNRINDIIENKKSNLYENTLIEMESFIIPNENILTIKWCLVFIKLLYKIIIIYNNNKIKNIYKKLLKVLRRNLLKYVHNNNIDLSDDQLDKIGSSISYYSDHNINNKINLNKSAFSLVLNEDDIRYINRY